jgi:uncharacterized membrane protein YdbT with pleckstrin-like domain
MSAVLIGAMVRQVLTMVGAYAVTAGVATGEQVGAIAGGVAVAVSVAWSWWKNKK